GLPGRGWRVVGLVALGWMLIGPGHHLFQVLLVSGYSNLVVLRLMAEFGVVAIGSIWIASLLAVVRERSAHGLDAADEDGTQHEKDDRASEHGAVTRVG